MRGNEMTDGLPLAQPAAHPAIASTQPLASITRPPSCCSAAQAEISDASAPSARRGSSQRQLSDEQRTMKILERLAGAADLGGFVVEPDETNQLQAGWIAMVSSVHSFTAATAGSPGHALMAVWMAAVARGMQLAAQQLDGSRLRQHSKQVNLLCELITSLSFCFAVLREGLVGGSDGGLEPVRVALSVLAVRAGVVKAHEQLSLRFTSIISCPQAASSATAAAQQQQMAPDVARLVFHHLPLLTSMAWAWPGGVCGLFSPKISQAALAAAGLAVEVLCQPEVLMQCEGGADNSSWQAACSIAAVLCNAYNAFAASGRSVPAQIAGGSSVGTLLLMWLGLAAQRLHQLQRGLSPAVVGAAPSAGAAGVTSAQQPRLAVPAHHTQLLQALGVPAGSLHPDNHPAAHDVKFWTQTLWLLLATPGQRQHLADAAAAASCQLPLLLLVLLECLLLDPAQDLLNVALAALQCTLTVSEVSEQTAWQLGPPLLRAILEQDACRRALEAAAAPAAAADVSDRAAGDLTVLEVLAMMARQVNTSVVAYAFDSGGSGGAACDDDAVSCHLPELAGLALVWLDHTAQCASLLEAGLRMMRPDSDLLLSAVGTAVAVDVAARARLTTGSSAQAADSQQQVFALLLSCLKAVAAVPAEQGSSSSSSSDGAVASEDAEQIWEIAAMMVQEAIVACCRLFFADSDSSSNNSSSSSSSDTGNQTSMAAAAAADATAGLSAQLGCVLLARCLVAAGRLLLQQQAQAPARDSASTSRLLLKACQHPAALLVQQLPQEAAAAAEPWLQQLLDEHAQLEQQLESLQAQMAAASEEANPHLPAAALAGLAEQLQAFGAAVCAALPVQQCCNRPDCRNLGQASELELVGGKSCLCGGCRVARYCSRECQVAHYKVWHKPLCKRLQAQRQQATAQQQQEPQRQAQEQQLETQQQQQRDE